MENEFEEFPPNKVYSFGPNAEVACWMHPYPIMYSADINKFEESLYHKEFEIIKKKILQLSLNLNLEQLDWIKASKVAALNKNDPFPNDPQTSYRIVDIFEDFENIPSPIKPQNREFIFECVWSVAQLDDEAFESKLSKFSNEIDVFRTCKENQFHN